MKFHHLWILSIVLVPFSSSSAKRYGGGSSYSSGSKPSGYNSKPGPSPTTNSKNKPSSGGGQYGPTYSTEKSYNNPNPAYKPATPAGAPTLASGGGGYNSRGGGGYSGTSLAGAAVGGTFFFLLDVLFWLACFPFLFWMLLYNSESVLTYVSFTCCCFPFRYAITVHPRPIIPVHRKSPFVKSPKASKSNGT